MKTKGFMFILISLAIFIVAITVMSNNTQNYTDYSNEFVKINTAISNYEIVLQTRAQDCNWIDTMTINDCIDSNSTLILSKLNKNNLNCSVIQFTITNPVAQSTLTCNEQIQTNEKEFEISLTKDIKLNKT
ncbi:MAG: hypothetical protein WC915_03075 [archaeon]|jgi:hypothetical protein